MKICGEFVLRQVTDEYLLIPVGKSAMEIKGMVALSESGYLICQMLQQGATMEEILNQLIAEYEVDEATACADTAAFMKKLQALGLVAEDSQ